MKIKSIILSTFVLLVFSTTWAQQPVQKTSTQQQTKKVTDQELHEFAAIYKDIQAQNQMMQQKAVKTIKDEGMTVDRFKAISKAKRDPKSTVKPTESEKKQLTDIKSKLQKVQMEMQQHIMAEIKEKGLTIQRYREISTSLRGDKALQQKLQSIMKG